MIRLLQGDVGSGKTIVALISMIKVFESNFQSALMVPTTILAFQHYENILKCFKSNKNVITEKPAVISLEEIKNLKNNLNNKIFFAEAFMYRYHPQLSKVIELIKNNYIGNLIEILITFSFFH